MPTHSKRAKEALCARHTKTLRVDLVSVPIFSGIASAVSAEGEGVGSLENDPPSGKAVESAKDMTGAVIPWEVPKTIAALTAASTSAQARVVVSAANA